MNEMLSPAVRMGTFLLLITVGGVIMSPDMAKAIEQGSHNAAGHWYLIAFAALCWLLWRPIKFALKFFFEGFFLGLGARESGVFDDRPRRRRWFW